MGADGISYLIGVAQPPVGLVVDPLEGHHLTTGEHGQQEAHLELGEGQEGTTVGRIERGATLGQDLGWQSSRDGNDGSLGGSNQEWAVRYPATATIAEAVLPLTHLGNLIGGGIQAIRIGRHRGS